MMVSAPLAPGFCPAFEREATAAAQDAEKNSSMAKQLNKLQHIVAALINKIGQMDKGISEQQSLRDRVVELERQTKDISERIKYLENSLHELSQSINSQLTQVQMNEAVGNGLNSRLLGAIQTEFQTFIEKFQEISSQQLSLSHKVESLSKLTSIAQEKAEPAL